MQILLVIVILVGSCTSETCKDIYLGGASDGKIIVDGLHHFKPNDSDPYLIYCDFKAGYGYTFISPTTFQNISLEEHHYERTEFKVVLLHSNGSQSQVIISKPEKSRDMEIQYYGVPYNKWLTNDLMYPYITVSMKTKKKNMTTRGYVVNGAKISNPVCDKNSNKKYARLIFGFLFNHNCVNPSQDGKRRKSTTYLQKWTESTSLIADDKRLPRNFFSFFEVKHKNCGGYMTSDDVDDVIGAAVGLKYAIRCGAPHDVLHTTKNISGYEYMSQTTYTCNQGYEFVHDSTTLTCSDKGEWQGTISTCILKKPRTCLDHVTMNSACVPGMYIVFDRNNTAYSVYCDFHENHTLTFLSPGNIYRNNFQYHYNDRTVFVVRSYLTDGRQVESEIRRLDEEYDHFEFSYELQRQRSDRYHSRSKKEESIFAKIPFNSYLYRYRNKYVGYNVNGIDVNETSYGYYREHYKVLEFKINLETPTRGYAANTMTLTGKWLEEARNITGERYMPKAFFFDYEISSDSHSEETVKNLKKLYGINIGFRHNK